MHAACRTLNEAVLSIPLTSQMLPRQKIEKAEAPQRERSHERDSYTPKRSFAERLDEPPKEQPQRPSRADRHERLSERRTSDHRDSSGPAETVNTQTTVRDQSQANDSIKEGSVVENRTDDQDINATDHSHSGPFSLEDIQNQLDADAIIPMQTVSSSLQETSSYETDKLPQLDVNLLSPLKGETDDATGNSKSKLAQAPILSILSGQLNEVPPTQIPTIVAENVFLQEAFSAEDITQYFQTPQDPKKLTQAILGGLTLEQTETPSSGDMLSPMNWFKQNGQDAQSILSEVTMMKDNIALEGLQGYVKRAYALQPTASQMQEQANLQATETINPQPTQLPNESVLEFPSSHMDEILHNQVIQQPKGSITPPVVSPQQVIDSSKPQLANTDQDMLDAFETIRREVKVDHIQNNKTSSLNQPNPPKVSDSLNLSENLQRLNLQSQALDTNKPQMQNQMNLATNSTIHAVQDGSIEGDAEPRFEPMNTPKTEVKQPTQTMTPLATNSGFQGNPEQKSSHDHRGGDRELSQRAQHEFRTEVAQSSIGLPFEGSRFEAQLSPKIVTETQQLKEMRQTILDRAHILVTNGGGSMKVGIGTPELGHLDLAIQVHDKNLELKITAATDRAREMLSQELPQLRQALLNQSLDLKTVQVGVASDQQWSQSFTDSQGGQQRESHSEQVEETQYGDYGRVFTSTKMSNLSRIERPANNQNRIQVRV